MRAVFLLTLLVLALASRALAGGAGGEYAVDVHDGEPFDDDATPNARSHRSPAAAQRSAAGASRPPQSRASLRCGASETDP